MGHGPTMSYSSFDAHVSRKGYKSMTMDELLDKKEVPSKMSPKGVTIRESRDSADHPLSYGIMFWQDETGSMGMIPAYMVKEGLGGIIPKLVEAGVTDPQLFMGAIGDHYADRSWLQVGQFECETELLDECLRSVYLEKGGGGQRKESYPVAWYFAGNHTSMDCFEKRGQKGVLITVGDEGFHPVIEGAKLAAMMGHGDFKSEYTAEELLKKAQETFEVFHIHANDGQYPNNEAIINQWKDLLGENFLIVDKHTDIPQKVVDITLMCSQRHGVIPGKATASKPASKPKDDSDLMLS